MNYKETDLYAPTLKASESLAASNGHTIYKTDTKQAYLYSDMGDDVVYGKKQAARKWHIHISD